MLGGLDYHSIAAAVKRALSGVGAVVGGLTSTGKIILSGAALDEAQGADIASAATIDLNSATGNLVDATGVAAITAITLAQGAQRTVRFTGALTLTNGASLVLPGGANITTAAGDYAIFRGYAAGVVRCVLYDALASSPLGTTGTAAHKGLLDLSAAAAGQIKFPATQNASANVNTLDDYEEGTFTPTGIGQTFTAATGFYTKIGRQVHVSLNLTWAVNGAGNQAGAGSLPFAVASTSSAGSLGFFNSTKLPMALFVNGASRIDFYQYAAGGPTMLDSDQSGSALVVSGVYYSAT